MKDKYQIILIVGTIFGASLLLSGLIMWGLIGVEQEKDRTLIGEGYVEDMRIEPQGGLIHKTYYFLVIKSKDYKIEGDYYYKVNVGDYVKIYESGKVVVVNSTTSQKCQIKLFKLILNR